VLTVPKQAPEPSVGAPAPLSAPDEFEEIVAASVEDVGVLENAAVGTADQLADIDESVHVEPLSRLERLARWWSWVWQKVRSLGWYPRKRGKRTVAG
jgi:hypothetical protein